MKAFDFLTAMHCTTCESVPTQIVTLFAASDLHKITGENGHVLALGENGISAGMYMYLYPCVESNAEFLRTLENTVIGPFADAVCMDAAGQTVVVFRIDE